MRVAGLLGANALMLAAGFGLLPLLGIARSWRELVARSGLAYLCGIVLAGIVAAHLALVHVSVGWIGLSVLALASLAAGALRLRGSERPEWRRPGWFSLAAVAALAAWLAECARAFAVAPLDRYDAWAIWALKGHALYAFGWADPTIFAGQEYRFANLDYPLLLPSLEAIDFRAMGAFDTRLLHLQFLLLLVAALAALGAVLRDRVPQFLVWLTLAAIASAPAVFDQLLTAYADLPLALVFAVGCAAAGRWLITNERWPLTVAYARVHDLHDINYSLTDTFDWDHISGRLGVARIAFQTLGGEMTDPFSWGVLLPVFGALLLLAAAMGARALYIYGLVWATLSWLGLSWIYVISQFEYSSYLGSTKERVIATVVLGGAALTPLLAAETWTIARARARPRGDAGRTP